MKLAGLAMLALLVTSYAAPVRARELTRDQEIAIIINGRSAAGGTGRANNPGSPRTGNSPAARPYQPGSEAERRARDQAERRKYEDALRDGILESEPDRISSDDMKNYRDIVGRDLQRNERELNATQRRRDELQSELNRFGDGISTIDGRTVDQIRAELQSADRQLADLEGKTVADRKLVESLDRALPAKQRLEADEDERNRAINAARKADAAYQRAREDLERLRHEKRDQFATRQAQEHRYAAEKALAEARKAGGHEQIAQAQEDLRTAREQVRQIKQQTSPDPAALARAQERLAQANADRYLAPSVQRGIERQYATYTAQELENKRSWDRVGDELASSLRDALNEHHAYGNPKSVLQQAQTQVDELLAQAERVKSRTADPKPIGWQDVMSSPQDYVVSGKEHLAPISHAQPSASDIAISYQP